jgi:integrase
MLLAERACERGNRNPVRLVFSRFLDEVQREHPGAYEAYRRTLVSFADTMPRETPVALLTAAHVNAWWETRPDWSETTRYTYLTIVLAALNWAARPENRLVDFNPLKGMKKPKNKSRGRETLLPEGAFERFYERIPRDFQEVVTALRETGTRPGNICRVRAADCDFSRMVWVLAEHKTAEKTDEPLLVPMTPKLAELCRELAARHPTGPLFRRKSGRGWEGKDIAHRFDYWRQKLRRQGVDLPENFFAYCFRHDLLSRMLEGGESESVVAAVAGHKGTRMLHRAYSHILGSARPMTEAVARLARARDGKDAAGPQAAGPASPPA